MRTDRYILFVFIILLSLILPLESFAQCKQKMVYRCAIDTKSIYLRDFNVKLRSGKPHESGMRWTVILNKNARYRFYLCAEEEYADAIIMNLYDSYHSEKVNPYKSTYDPRTGKVTKSFDFICRKSGIYYFSIRIKEGTEVHKVCAVGILSFVEAVN